MAANEQYVDIQPIGKRKRILVFLADFFITFIIAFILMNAAVFPLGTLFTGNNEKSQNATEAEVLRDNILYGNEILFYKNTDDKYVYEKNLEYTFERYLSYYAFDSENAVNPEEKYGNSKVNEVIYHYWNDIRGDLTTYKNYVKDYLKEYPCLEKDGDLFKLTSQAKSQMQLHFLSNEDMSKDGARWYENMKQFFLNNYSLVMSDVKTNNLSYNGNSYSQYQKLLDEYDTYYDQVLIVCSFISFVLGWFTNFLIFPLINKNNKTIGMLFLKRMRIGTNNLYLTSKKEVVLHSVLALPFNIASMAFMPLFYVSFFYLLNMPFLFGSFIVSIVLIIASFIVLMFNKFNQTLFDLITRSVLITNESMDEINKAKGYYS